jgi:hypothetical protein
MKHGAARFSLGHQNAEEDMDAALEAMRQTAAAAERRAPAAVASHAPGGPILRKHDDDDICRERDGIPVISKRATVLLVLLLALAAVVAFASACGGSTATTLSGSATSIQVVTTAAPTATTQGAATLDSYRTAMKALWGQFGPVLQTLDTALSSSDPANMTDAELQSAQGFLDGLNSYVAGLQKVQPPADLADAHAKYTATLGKLAGVFDTFLTAAKSKDSAAATAAFTAIGTLYTQEGDAMAANTAILEKALGFALSGDSSSTDTTAATLGNDAQTYTDATYGFSFQYPATWKISNDTSIDATGGASATGQAAVFDPDGVSANDIFLDLMMVSTYPQTVTITDADIPALESQIQTLLDGLEGQATNAQVLSPLVQTQLGALKGYTVTYGFDKESVPCTSTLYFLFRGNMEYMVTIQAANQNWESNQDTFAAMLASFTAP